MLFAKGNSGSINQKNGMAKRKNKKNSEKKEER